MISYKANVGPQYFKLSIITMALIALCSSCSIKKKEKEKEKGPQAPSAPYSSSNAHLDADKNLLDSDGDGIPDSVELQNGTNPFVANIPEINVSFSKSASLGALFHDEKGHFLYQVNKDIGLNGGPSEDYLKALRKKVLLNQSLVLKNIDASVEDKISNDDLSTSILSSWKDDLYYPFLKSFAEVGSFEDDNSGKYILQFKLKVSKALNVSKVSNIKFQSFFYNRESLSSNNETVHNLYSESGAKEVINTLSQEDFSLPSIYSLIRSELPSPLIKKKIMDREELGIRFIDYDYISSGVQLNYKETFSKVLENDAKIIISTPDKTEIFYVTPGVTLKYALESYLKKEVQSSNGKDLLSFEKIESTGLHPMDLDYVDAKGIEENFWSIFGDGDNLESTLQAKGFYVLSLGSAREILNAGRSLRSVKVDEAGNEFTLNNVFLGDEVLLDVSEIAVTNYFETFTTAREVIPVFLGFPQAHVVNDICDYTYSAIGSSQSQVNLKEDLTKWIKISSPDSPSVEFSTYQYGNKVRIVFDKALPVLRNKLKISLQKPDLKTTTIRQGLITATDDRQFRKCKTANFQSNSMPEKVEIKKAVSVLGAYQN